MANKKSIKYVLYGMKRNTTFQRILNSGTAKVHDRKEIISLLSENYGIKEMGGLKYDGRCGIYLIYKTGTDAKGRYYVLHIERK